MRAVSVCWVWHRLAPGHRGGPSGLRPWDYFKDGDVLLSVMVSAFPVMPSLHMLACKNSLQEKCIKGKSVFVRCFTLTRLLQYETYRNVVIAES